LAVRFLRDVKAVPLKVDDKTIEVAFADPSEPWPGEAIAFATRRTLVPFVGRRSDIEAALERLYGRDEDEAGREEDALADEADLERLKDLASDAPVVRAVNQVIARAVDLRASDIHLEPTEDNLKVRFRIDGTLQDTDPLPAYQKSAIVSRIKV